MEREYRFKLSKNYSKLGQMFCLKLPDPDPKTLFAQFVGPFHVN